MKIHSVTLENFRRYKERTTISFSNMTAFIGRNDAGKSTVLEALDIFFENSSTKIDMGDASSDGNKSDVRITVEFEELPSQLDLDAGAVTTLEAEHLLNSDSRLEITKVYDCTKSSCPSKIFAHANHPSANEFSGLLAKKITDLKKIVKSLGIEDHCHQNNNPSMRRAIYEAASNLELSPQDVLLKDGDAKNVWEAIKKELPIYALFRSDRVSSDQDPEVQDPMKLAIKSALAELNEDLVDITAKIEKFAGDTADRTIQQLKASFPDLDIASVLKPQFRQPKWDSVFKIDLESDDSIPLNKRGSGIRRLVLLSFFQAEAARKKHEKDTNGRRVPVIYAIEEPETSQHPDSQERIVRALSDLSQSGDQVILTTHVPGLAGLLPVDSIRFVDTHPSTMQVRVRDGSDDVLSVVAESLGVLPEASNLKTAKVAVAVEGPTDVDALVAFGNTLLSDDHISNFDPSLVFWTIGGGQTLKDWIERKYLDRIGLPQVFIFDSDRTSGSLPLSRDKQELQQKLNAKNNCAAFVTRKRTIENYMHWDAVVRTSDGHIVLDSSTNMDFGNVSKAFKEAFETAKERQGSKISFTPVNLDGVCLGLGTSEKKCKKIITSYIMAQMTSPEILDRGAYTDENGEERNEIMEWLTAII
ncbi:MAG: ATP-binding protein, partial [Pseudomonadota bacterium]